LAPETGAEPRAEPGTASIKQMSSARPAGQIARAPRPHAASAVELARHSEFVAGIGNALWSS
jgi:DNA polymerase-3 subunit epsilon